MPLRMVSVTSPPAITAPLTSKIAATASSRLNDRCHGRSGPRKPSCCGVRAARS
ncbi:Uncharacterised protein [Mycobacterium tuberculosis]|uniref:Uncharacterized protein n=1 Tax=Mycobacterium tuberculosis TaxID=1773 RepID=A0A916P8W7_MYCTX|nr:Uncharacterised protein [Mycobacterium tuberculosis]